MSESRNNLTQRSVSYDIIDEAAYTLSSNSDYVFIDESVIVDISIDLPNDSFIPDGKIIVITSLSNKLSEIEVTLNSGTGSTFVGGSSSYILSKNLNINSVQLIYIKSRTEWYVSSSPGPNIKLDGDLKGYHDEVIVSKIRGFNIGTGVPTTGQVLVFGVSSYDPGSIPTGPQGPIGPQGPQGPTGPQGATGPVVTNNLGDLSDVGTTVPTAANLLISDGTLWNSGPLTDASHQNLGGGLLHSVATRTSAGFMASTDKANLDNQVEAMLVQGEPSGFPVSADNTTSTITITDGTRTFQIAPTGSSYDIWIKGSKTTKTGAESVNWTDVEGLHFFYFNTSGVLTHTVNEADIPPVILGNGVFVFALYWSVATQTSIVRAEERHGLMDGKAHLHFHQGFGAQWYSGGDITFVAGAADLSGTDDTHAQIAVSNVIYADEDILYDIQNGVQQTLSPVAQLPVYYLTGTGDWLVKPADDFPVVWADGVTFGTVGDRCAYNQFTGGVWQLTEVTNDDFFLIHVFGFNDVDNPIMAVLGQAEYLTFSEARAGAEVELTRLSELGKLLSAELVPLATIIYQTQDNDSNTPKCHIISATSLNNDYIDWRTRNLSGGSAGAGTNDHGALTGLADDDHLQYLHTSNGRTVTAQHIFNFAGAPFTLGASAQGNLVSGLNADLLDGQQGIFYQDASNLSSGTLPAGRFNDTSHGIRAGGNLHAAATTSVAGFMSVADKAKLDGISGTVGDVSGPVSSTDNAFARFDGTTGKLIQNSGSTLDDSGNATFSGSVEAGNSVIVNNSVDAGGNIAAGGGFIGAYAEVGSNAASAGDIRLPFGGQISAVDDASGTNDLNLLSLNGTGDFFLGDATYLSAGFYDATTAHFMRVAGTTRLAVLGDGARFTNTAYFSSEFSAGNTGASITIDFANGQKQAVTVTANTTITLTAPGVGNYQLKIEMDGTGGHTVAFPASPVYYAKDGVLNISQGAGTVTVVSCYYDGTSWFLGSLPDMQVFTSATMV